MADIKRIELASDIYGLEDETARDSTETNASAIGTLASLATTVKTNLVAAINEVVDEKADESEFTTTKITVTPQITKGHINVLRSGKIVSVAITDVKFSNLEGYTSIATGLPPISSLYDDVIDATVLEAGSIIRNVYVDKAGNLNHREVFSSTMGEIFGSFTYLTD